VNRLLVVLVSALVLAPGAAPVAAQPIEFPTGCSDVLASGSIFIGHDCGEWASIMIVGSIVIRTPWERANPASRAVRIRANRERAGVAELEPTRTPRRPSTTSEPTAKSTRTPRRTREPREPAAGDTTMFGVDISQGNPDDLDCPDFASQEDAQELFDAQGWSETNDPYGLDERGRGDGVPCESNPTRP
jgi:hypothetical protein